MNSQESVNRGGGNGLEDKLLLMRNKEYLRENCEEKMALRCLQKCPRNHSAQLHQM